MKTAKERLERLRLDTGLDLRYGGTVCLLIEDHERDVVEAIADYLAVRLDDNGPAILVRSGAWRKAGK